MRADNCAEIEPSLGQKAIAETIADAPGPIVREEDGFDGDGKEHAQTVAQAHVYRLLTRRSFFEMERHLDKYPWIRKKLGLGHGSSLGSSTSS